ncbi:glycogen debranching protein GlgX [Aldersonia kunmingensis]|uniref:glycogen debranching protein GlgX n=1 Tax=Aldersonia kunmingensis TaxID=408066 RepID=UPI000A7CADF3|nr:glycogen debranching protein GlgX [Aldersonia kunmingensis]
MSDVSVPTLNPIPGSPFPLGATVVATGVQFAVHAPQAERVQVCLIGDDGHEQRLDLPHLTAGIWHGVIDGVPAGQRYGYRAHGPWDPRNGLRFNPQKLLIDPSTRRLVGELGDVYALFAHDDGPFGGPSTRDSFGHVPLSVVTPELPVATSQRLETAWEETVILEVHVGSYTARHPDVPRKRRGTYLGLASDAVLDHLNALGVTAVELLPVQAFLTEASVRDRGMRNHWGYSTAAYFAPHPGYASVPGREVEEFREMTDRMHAAGIEVLLDVVYNHTCETGVGGPTLSWRGLDAPGYYQLAPNGWDIDLTGCGNTVNAYAPATVRMICDSLRYWVEVLGVDGFRFDLATVLGRDGGATFDYRAPLLSVITADPVLRRCKLIAEPWDATARGYELGAFPQAWSEWNDRFRDDARRFWQGHHGVREIASRLAGSADVVGHKRRAWTSVNFITAHDGFTLRDLVSYSHKHNRANGEDNRDGANNNLSVNHGHEGSTGDPEILEARARHMRALLATLLLSTGTPMLLGGDELGHTQRGNNNAYCVPVDKPASRSWAVHWAKADPQLTAYVSALTALRRAAPALRQPEFFEGRETESGHADLVWFGGDGTELDEGAWNDDGRRTLQMWIDGSDVRSHSAASGPLADTGWCIVLHSGPPAPFVLGAPEWFDGTLEPVFDSSAPDGTPSDRTALPPGAEITLTGATVLALRAVPAE